MTGFGRSVISCDGREITMEIKSVNHRFLDIGIRAPRVYVSGQLPIDGATGKMAEGVEAQTHRSLTN
ncbi:MAG: hypothetical protein KH317_04200, partial [Clostridiales bacterium]|nr:hypothetical protein [Clostridiales bacterium]